VNPFWLIPFAPAAGAVILILLGRFLSKKVVSIIACSSVAVSFLLALVSFGRLAAAPGESAPLVKNFFTWINVGSFRAEASFRFDPLAAVMVLIITGVGLLIHIYSTGYMACEKSTARYFAALNLFAFAMLVLVLASNLVLMFVGWEGVGLCSYLLIGYWFEKPTAAAAGKKAFLVNRTGDAGFILGVLVLLVAVGSGEFSSIDGAVAGGALARGTATWAALLLFVGAAGKSAQIPLYVWLPDAMEGPTPVSALIHAATMVTAGVYMVARLGTLYEFSGTGAQVVGLIGAATAVFAATMALVQNDIKRVLAYSTISQLGYMFLGCGVGAYAAGVFHLTTHAFFKSLLFLSAGSVMHALSGESDMRRMGGLRKYLPRTYPAFLIGAIAIAGVPFLSGFFSKDAILNAAYTSGHRTLWALGLGSAVLTAFYMFRLVFLTFHGPERMSTQVKTHLHESPASMTVPLLILAGLAVVGGYIWLPAVLGEKADLFKRWLEPVLPAGPAPHIAASTGWILILLSTAAAAIGIGLAFLFYRLRPSIPVRLAGWFPRFHTLLLRKYYVDEIYDAVLVRPLLKGSDFVYRNFDLRVIDGALDGAAAAAGSAGRLVNALQSGLIKDYALAVLLGAAVFLGLLWL
jgi:NADH-quinone oxidoreductase subunit L